MAQELKVYRDPKEGPCWREFYEKSEVDAVLAEKDAEIRRLKRALWLALGAVHKAKAKHEQFIILSNPQWEGTPAGLKTHKKITKYEGYAKKCRAKAEDYK